MTARRSSPSARATAAKAVRASRAAGDPARRDGMRAYFKRDEQVSFFGVAMPAVRRLARDVWSEVKGEWGVREALVFAGRLVERTELEAKILGILVLARFEATFPRGLLGTVRSWLANDLLASWAAVDAAAPWIITPLIRRHPDLGDRVMRWTAARSLWVRRSAPVAFIPLARHGERLDEAYAIAASLLDDRDDLMHQATGWMLREAGKTDVRRLERFLRAHGPRIPRTTLRYAIERFPPARRRRLLRETR